MAFAFWPPTFFFRMAYTESMFFFLALLCCLGSSGIGTRFGLRSSSGGARVQDNFRIRERIDFWPKAIKLVMLEPFWANLLTAFQNGSGGRPNLVALGC